MEKFPWNATTVAIAFSLSHHTSLHILHFLIERFLTKSFYI